MLRPTTTKPINPTLRLLNSLRAGSKPIMTFLGLPSFRTAQMVAQTGLDVRFIPPIYPMIQLELERPIINTHGFLGDNH